MGLRQRADGVGRSSQAMLRAMPPDYQFKIIKQISFPGLDLSALHLTNGK